MSQVERVPDNIVSINREESQSENDPDFDKVRFTKLIKYIGFLTWPRVG